LRGSPKAARNTTTSDKIRLRQLADGGFCFVRVAKYSVTRGQPTITKNKKNARTEVGA